MRNLIILLVLLTMSCFSPPTKIEIPQAFRWEAAGTPSGILNGPSLYITDGSASYWPDKLVLAIQAHKIGPTSSISGTIRYKADVLSYQDWTHGKWFGLGTEHIWKIDSVPGALTFHLKRHEAIPDGGEVILFHFVATDADIGSRSTFIGWENPRVNDSSLAALGGAVYIN